MSAIQLVDASVTQAILIADALGNHPSGIEYASGIDE